MGDFSQLFWPTDPATQMDLEYKCRQARELVQEGDTTDTFWVRLFELETAGVYKYRELARGVIKMLSLPISNGGVERIFSDVNHLKSPKRSLLSHPLLTGMLYSKHGLEFLGQKLSSFKPSTEMCQY